MRPLYIFDLDGTLALLEHRRHHVTNGNKNWDAFHAACVDDKPNTAVIEIYQTLEVCGNDLWIWSGRVDSVKNETAHWLQDHGIYYKALMMRPHGYYIPDDKLKAAWYADMNGNDKRRLVATFDDRDRMVQMWRDHGITCLQVAPGDF